ncbi:MAG: hypothetical protein ACLTAN_01380 [Christensenellaceae bacterium]
MVEKVAVIRGFKGFQKILTQKISSTYYAGSYIKTNGAATIYFWRTIGEQAMKAFIYKGLNVFFDGSNPFLCATDMSDLFRRKRDEFGIFLPFLRVNRGESRSSGRIGTPSGTCC